LVITPMTNVTHILSAIEQGDLQAAEQLLPLVYDELRKLAARKLAQEKPGQTLQATALVHEAYLRLVGQKESQHWNSRGHFFAAVGEAMRRILVEQARRRAATKRGGQIDREILDPDEIVAPGPDEQILAIHDALDSLAQADPDAAVLVKLRFFGGMTMGEAADALGISIRSAQDLWAYARTWLRRRMRSV
jgi:RNA polymerase sigma factor (TIGR02999 family)